MATIKALGNETDATYFFWGDQTYVGASWDGVDFKLIGEWVQPDLTATDPWGSTRKSVPLNGQPVIGYNMKEYTVETDSGPFSVGFNVEVIAFCPLTDVLGVMFTRAIGSLPYTDPFSVNADYFGYAIHAWPISSDGFVGNPLQIGNYDFDEHFLVTHTSGVDFRPNGCVADSATRLRMLDALDDSDLVLDVTRTDLTLVSAPAAWSNGIRVWGQLDAYENFQGECWYASGVVVAKVAKNAAGHRVYGNIALVPDGFDVDPAAHTIIRVGGDEAVVMTVYGLTGFSYPDCQWAVFEVKGGVVTKVDVTWATINHRYMLVDTPLDEFQTLVVLRADAIGEGSTPWPTYSIQTHGGDWMIAAFDYPALTKQDLNWQVLLHVGGGGSGS